MNICFLAFLPMIPYECGVQRVTTVLSQELSRRGHSIVFLCYSESRKHKISNPEIEYPQYYLDITSGDKEVIKDALMQFIDNHRIEVVINQTPDVDSALILSLVPSRVKVVSESHVVPFFYHNSTRRSLWRVFPSNTLRIALHKTIAITFPRLFSLYANRKEKRIIESVLPNSDRFVFISERYFDRILHYLPDFPKEKLVAINNPNAFETQNAIDYSTKKNVVLWVGRLDPNKNCMAFVKAWRLFYVNHPNWTAIVAGDGSMMHICKEYVNSHQLNNIEFLGYCKEVKSLYKDAKLFVSTSYNESWGMSITEAMSLGCVPVVYNTYETLTDILQDGINGYLCEPNPKALAAKLSELVEREGQICNIGIAAQKYVERFSSAVICDEWESLLNGIIK